ncbi:hypothetical protein [Campylobacter geochelonis]|uniref:hypothetical protein n=1 Tax=Campylobacter geochelonis TaxID=1780362 RepID=UPI00077070FC|nr:hypothetical protein [Campylobacter geochelonis]CZE49827.1 Uncharacterised protein [Campylobacter geochelonis]
MKFFIISLALNLALLFLPFFNINSSLKGEEIAKEMIKITINEISKIETSDEISINKPNEGDEKEQKLEQKVVNEVENITKTKNIKKSSSKKVKKIALKEIKQESKFKQTSSLNNAISDVCKENEGFKILNPKQNYKFPKKATMLRIKGKFRVDVSFRLDNGKVEIIKVLGDNQIFKDEAVRLTKALEIVVLDKKVSSCTIVKPFVFELN